MFRRNDDSNERRDYRNVAPPADLNKKQPYVDVSQIKPNPGFGNLGRKRTANFDDEYFEDDDDQPNFVADEDSQEATKEEDEDEEDPLDAFMAGIETEVKAVSKKSTSEPKAARMASKKDIKVLKGVRGDIEEEDTEEAYYKYMQENPNAGLNSALGDSDAEEDQSGSRVEYDADGNPIYVKGKDVIEPLPRLNHDDMKYEPFSKNFYEEQPDIASLTEQQVRDLRAKQNIKVFGSGAPKPVTSFAHFGFEEQLMKVIRKSEYTQPTPIQAQAIPVALSGRDLIGIAKTGSGKTAAYLWPMIVHVMDQRNLKVGEGPIGLILAPTRELSQQIYTEAKKFGKTYNINVVCAYGGGSKWEQSKDLEAGAEIVVATPGRLIDLIKMKATNLQRVTCLVLDEADRMFSLGFEPQVRSICDSVRPDRQTMLFSATFKKRIEKLARDILTDPIKILQGDTGEANEDISQTVLYFEEGTKKWEWLTENLVGFMSAGSVLIFVSRIANAEELAMNLAMKQFEALLIHGDMGQASRNEVISAFKRKDKPILVATDIAARGLDISHIRTVVNYDVARDIDTHTHRIGRTGRAGEKGYAYTLVTEKDKEFAGHLVRNLEGANQPVPQQLMNLALQSEWFKSSRFNQGGVKRTSIGGSGLGYSQKSRPGLGAPKPTTSFVASSTPYNSLAASSSDGSQSNSKSAASDSVSSSRFASVKAQYSAHYMNKFKAATDTAWKAEPKPEPEASKKKSRWDS